jgi:DNA-binding winged helix-turn-helix (wHTH) protein
MRVNSAFMDFLNNRVVVRSRATIVMLAIFFMASSFTKHPDRDLRAKQVNLTIRQIGHRLLLQAGDSTSRVLPVMEAKEGTFLLRFENEFNFDHDSLLALSRDFLPEAQFPSGYTVTVHDCLEAGIVYGFQVNNTSPDILPCKGRSQPPGCYTIEFTFPDFYEHVEQKNADIEQPTRKLKSVKVDRQEANPKLKEFKTTTFDHGIGQMTEELKSFKVASPEANLKPEELKTTTFDYPFIYLVCSGMLVLLGVTLFIGRFWKNSTPVLVQNQDHAIVNASMPEFAALGKFLFDVKGHRLLLGSEVIRLTDKECTILELLNDDFSELINRETLMQKVWISEGVITGRSLDMFVSKLRKKLSSDPELRITNVHGKGYKLEIRARTLSPAEAGFRA